MISNKNFQLDSIKDKNERLIAHESLYEMFCSLSSTTWLNLSLLPKFKGIETISYKHFSDGIKKSFANVPILSEDSKLDIIRFCEQKYRIIGKQKDNILYVIAYDLDYSAYSHS